jgi:hypothetical protein
MYQGGFGSLTGMRRERAEGHRTQEGVSSAIMLFGTLEILGSWPGGLISTVFARASAGRGDTHRSGERLNSSPWEM